MKGLLRAGVLLAVVGVTAGRPGADAQSTSTPARRTYDVEAYDVDGAKLLQVVDIENAVYPFLGPDRTVADIEAARAALEKLYRDRGFSSVVVELPAQTVADDIVRLHVVEATVGRLRVTGSRYFSPDGIRQEAAAFAEGGVPNIDKAQKELAQLNRASDLRVTPVLRAGVVPGTVDVDLKVSDTFPLHASVELNNDHNQYTEPLRTIATIHYDDLWQLEHSVSFTYDVAPQDRANSEIFAGSYLAPLANSPVSLLVSGYHSNSNVASLASTTVLGKGYSVGGRAIYQFPNISGLSQSISLGIDFKDVAEKIQISTTPATSAIIEYWPITATYNLQQEGAKTSAKLALSVTVGTPGLGSNTSDFENTRFDARPEFVHVNLDLDETETLWRGFQASQRVVGQIADGSLVSSEEFAAGGLTSVRGYLQAEAVGDEGLTGSLELLTPSLAPSGARWLDSLKVFAFADGGSVWVLLPQVDQTKFFALASAGAGLRLALLRHLTADVALAVPFISGVATHADHPRATFSLKSDF
jgi:hemolysin activation/secretion protein